MTDNLDRRLFMTATAGLALAGCDRVAATKPGRDALDSTEKLTHWAQRQLNANKLAQEFPASAKSKLFKPNGSIDPKDPAYKKLAEERFESFSLSVGGLVAKPRAFGLKELRALPARTQITRHDCVEGWSCIGEWTGVPLADLLRIVEPKPEANFVLFNCFDRYDTDFSAEPVDKDVLEQALQTPTFYGSIGMNDAYHPQTILAYAMNGEPLPVPHGAPLRVRVERQLGYKMTKYIKSIELVASFAEVGKGKGGYWEDEGYEWYGGI